MKIIANNKKAFHDYEILEKYEAGISLKGSEIKSIRNNGLNIKESYIKINSKNIVQIINMNISPYTFASFNLPDPTRTRDLLMHKKEIIKLKEKVQIQGITLVPLKVYFKGDWVKIEIGVAKGKKLHDKRQAIKERDIKREIDKAIKNY